MVASILSQPLPLLAETVAFAAGGSSLPWHSAGRGHARLVPAAVVYAVAEAAAATLGDGAVVFVAVAALAIGATLVLRPRTLAPEASRL